MKTFRGDGYKDGVVGHQVLGVRVTEREPGTSR